jgi:TRAP-type C4-dicarboxylate transport system permease small subunit
LDEANEWRGGTVKRLLKITLNMSRFMNAIAGITLTFMMMLTVTDVVLRYLRMPILGSYDLVSFSAAVVIGFSLPFTSWVRGHVGVDLLIPYMGKRSRDLTFLSTRIISMALFFLAGIYLFRKAINLHQSGQVSLTLQIPLYPIACGVGICCFCLCLVLIADIIKIIGGEYE